MEVEEGRREEKGNRLVPYPRMTKETCSSAFLGPINVQFGLEIEE